VGRIGALLLCLALLGAGRAVAVTPDEMLKDPGLEARARALSAELRCMVCQNQSIDDSDAPLAHDLRLLLRERLTAGDTDQQAIDYLVARYGEFILLRPRLSAHTVLLWATPMAVLVIGGVAIAFAIRRRQGPVAGPELSDQERQRLAGIIEREETMPAMSRAGTASDDVAASGRELPVPPG
jgi:cytochrome c-type biogenesis protein CcmH